MKKYLIFIPCFVLGTALAQNQTQSRSTGGPAKSGAATARQAGAPSPGQSGAPRQNISRPGVPPWTGGRVIITNDPSGANRVSGVTSGETNNIRFGATNQIPFGGTNTGRFLHDPSGANQRQPIPFGGTNHVQFAPNQGTALPTNNTPTAGSGTIQEPSGAINPNNLTNPNNPNGSILPNGAAAADAAFTQQMNAALARGGATKIFFPQTRSTITLMNQNGSVLLTGSVANEAERRNIEARVKASTGVTSVENQLQIGGGTNPSIIPRQNVPSGNENQRQLLNP